MSPDKNINRSDGGRGSSVAGVHDLQQHFRVVISEAYLLSCLLVFSLQPILNYLKEEFFCKIKR